MISGIVQGVGFRPLVYHIAVKHGITGTVQNTGGIVQIIAQAEESEISDFLKELKSTKKGSHEIQDIEITDLSSAAERFQDFQIVKSSEDRRISIIPPDLPVCKDCERELYQNTDRRFQNPFISCMSCGPRYTIVEALPYDRHNTTMRDFEMCHVCKSEYTDPDNRRFHAQTISCDECGPYLLFAEPGMPEADFSSVSDFSQVNRRNLERACEVLEGGGIIAVKGIGGYHFACSPFCEQTVLNLRKLKGRENKPFAVMFESLESVEAYCQVDQQERKLLLSNARPIVLLRAKENQDVKAMVPSVGKESLYCGAFLPYTPLQILLLNKFGPLIMTSANISDCPVIRDDIAMSALDSPYLDGILYNKRRIVRSVDDSVVKVTDGRKQMIRRSRGYVPYPVFLGRKSDKVLFAAGSDMKAASCFCYSGNAVVSQYFGDLEERSVLVEYEHAYDDLTALLKIEPELAICDLHPNYYSAKFASSLGKELIKVQHHHAHIASVMAEHKLSGPVIGIAFDGTGYGTDGNVWGGEFLVCEGAEFTRAGHLDYVRVIGGDASVKDAAKTAACYMIQAGIADQADDSRIDIITAAIQNQINTNVTSSMGRLFDAVSAILGICSKSSFEGEAATLLEKSAQIAKETGIAVPKLSFSVEEKDGMILIDALPVIRQLAEMRKQSGQGVLALAFHEAVTDMAVQVCLKIREKNRISTVAISGGVFQNSILNAGICKTLCAEGFTVYSNRDVPSNDGGISLGQIFIGLMR